MCKTERETVNRGDFYERSVCLKRGGYIDTRREGERLFVPEIFMQLKFSQAVAREGMEFIRCVRRGKMGIISLLFE